MGYDAYSLVDFEELFDATVLSGQVGVRKPSRRIYRLGAEAAGVDVAECVLVDDIDRNLAGAARIGVAGILHAEPEATAAELERHLGLDLSGTVASP